MSGYVVKAAGRDQVVTLDWGRGFLAPGETLVEDLGWEVAPGQTGAAAVQVRGVGLEGSLARVEIRGGAPDRYYMVSSRVRTSAGRVLQRAIVLRIAPGPAPDLRSSG